MIKEDFISNHRASLPSRDQGVALVLVVFVIALATILVVNLAYSTYIGGRLSSSSQRRLEAEYLLKSTLNLARVLIRLDVNQVDKRDDPWFFFVNGAPIPQEWLELSQPNLQLELEIRPEEAKISLSDIVRTAGAVPGRRDILVRLFRLLGFDDDEEVDQGILFRGRRFSAEEMAANLIDYIDSDKESYRDPDGNFKAAGVESEVPEGIFPNEGIKELTELAAIPGFTPTRVRKLLPFITTKPTQVSINVAPPVVLKSLHGDITDQMISQIIQFRTDENGPFKSPGEVQPYVGQSIYDAISVYIGKESRYFQVIAKVDYGTSVFFMRAVINKPAGGVAGDLPEIKSVEMF